MPIKRMNFGYLLGGLLILLLSVAIAQEEGVMGETRRLFLEPVLCLMLLAGIWSHVSKNKWLTLGGAILAGSGVATAMIDFFFDIPNLRLVNIGILLVFSQASIWIAYRHLVLSGAIDLNKIIGAICIYLLLGLNWSVFYLFINMANPESFHGLTSTAIDTQFSEFLYYSFVTITTSGYGDITPAKPIARTVAYLEAIVGQFYVAVLVAWLVGMYLSDKTHTRKNP
ncbi:MAG: potassium channel family protein [Nitrospirales bacterium]|nr:two pore domain potassium channel family protein [Nitrospira sp.]MDR4461894.1 potassium channel family protein [Nitrospirales bacterium]MDR4483898.1 potassium channel family protein [Nitrospirales bacterium]